jgi:outer membrane protein assembly factor BamB
MTKFEIRMNAQITNVPMTKRICRVRFEHSSFEHLNIDSNFEFRHSNLAVALVFLLATTTAHCRLAIAAQTDAAPPPMRYAPPEVTFDGVNQLQLLTDEIDHKQTDKAAVRLESLLRDSLDALQSTGNDQSVFSIDTWVQNLPADKKAILRPAYESMMGPAAQQAVEEIKSKPEADPAEFYALSRRYPFTNAVASALAEGARRSAILGDVPSARWMLDAAVAAGWQADASLQRELDRAVTPSNFYTGPLPFEAGWYGLKTRLAWAALRSFPAAAGNVIFIVGPGQVMAVKENGEVLWQGPIGAEPTAGRGASAPMGVTRGPPFAPAILCDSTGAPALVVVRQPEVHGTGWALRALRASDGHLLWTTEAQDDLRGLVFGSNPVIAGRYVYAIAGDVTDQLDHLWLVALEATTGTQLWRCDIGSQSRTIVPRIRSQPPMEVYRPWLNESAPVVTKDMVIASPNVGAVIAVGRFDGKLRWTHGYQTLSDPTLALQRQREWAIEHPTSLPPLATGLSLRWANSPMVGGDVVVSAPEDSDQVIAMSIVDGKPLWNSSAMPDATLVGIGGGTVVMEGESISGLKIADGSMGWKNFDPVVLGPAVLHDTSIIAPSATGLVILSAATGTPITVNYTVPAFDTIIASEPTRGVLIANDVAHCFGISRQRSNRR